MVSEEKVVGGKQQNVSELACDLISNEDGSMWQTASLFVSYLNIFLFYTAALTPSCDTGIRGGPQTPRPFNFSLIILLAVSGGPEHTRVRLLVHV